MKAAKAWVVGALAILTVVKAALTDDAISAVEIGEIVAVIAGTLGVYWVPNQPDEAQA